jgi:acyl-CoA synthetase (AMP-forming)/AMP-acid ligase II
MINFRLAPAEILKILIDSQASVLMVHEEYVDHVKQIRNSLGFIKYMVHIGAKIEIPDGWLDYETLIENASADEPAVEISEDDLAALMYTSGTTGEPKGCMATHRNFYHVGRSMTHELQMHHDDIGIIPVPMFHATGICVLMNGVYGGITSIIMRRWNTEDFMQLVEKYKVTTGMLATPMLLFIVNHPQGGQYELGSLKKLMFAGAPVTSVVFRKAIERFGNIFIHGYGATETMGSACILRPEEVAKALADGRIEILGSCGRSYIDTQAEVVGENGLPVPPGVVGEIRVRGLGMTLGYWNKEEETRRAFRDGWYYSDDLGRVDEYGYIYVDGRKTEMIITGGENVFPAEVENVLYKHPAVGQVAVIGIQHEKWGEAVTAFVVKKHGVQVSEDELRSFCRKELAGYKVPQKVFWVESLPRSASGKLLKNKLKEQFARRPLQQARNYFAKRSFTVSEDD